MLSNNSKIPFRYSMASFVSSTLYTNDNQQKHFLTNIMRFTKTCNSFSWKVLTEWGAGWYMVCKWFHNISYKIMTKWHVIVKKLDIWELKSMHIPEGGKFRDRKSSMPRPTKFKRHNLFELGLILVPDGPRFVILDS